MVQFRFFRWLLIFILFVVAAFLLISSPLSNDFSQLTVEIVGAFVGIVGALILKKSVEDVSQLLEARKLKRDLLNSMHIMLGQRSRDDPRPWRFLRWEIAMHRSEFALLERATYQDFFLVNVRVELNNELVKEWRECVENPDACKKPRKTLKERALNAEKGLIEITWETLRKYGIKLNKIE